MFSQEVTQPVLVLLNAKNLQRKETAKKKPKKTERVSTKEPPKSIDSSGAAWRPHNARYAATRSTGNMYTSWCIYLPLQPGDIGGLQPWISPTLPSFSRIFFFFHKCVIREHPGTHSLLSASHPPYQTGSVGFRQYPLENIYTKQSAVVWCPQSPVNGLHISWLINPRQELFVPG